MLGCVYLILALLLGREIAGNLLSCQKIKEKGILNGAILGILYMFILYIISSIANGSFALNVSSLAMIGIGIIAGILGGILGVNLNNK